MPEAIAISTDPAVLAEQLASSLADSLEAMAFITLQPADPSAAAVAPAEPVRLSILVRGPMRGVVEIAAPRALGLQLGANVLEPGATPSLEAGDDALRELLNVVCGCFLRNAMPPGCEMELPSLRPMSPEQWIDFTSGRGAMTVDAEGSLVSVRTALVAAV